MKQNLSARGHSCQKISFTLGLGSNSRGYDTIIISSNADGNIMVSCSFSIVLQASLLTGNMDGIQSLNEKVFLKYGNFDLENLKYCNHILSSMRIDDVAIFKSTSEQKQSKL